MLGKLTGLFGKKNIDALPDERPDEKPTTSLSEVMVRSMVIVTDSNRNAMEQIAKKDIWLGNDNEILTALKANEEARMRAESGVLVRCDHPNHPFLIQNNKFRAQIWKRHGMPAKGENLVMILSNVVGPAEKVISYMPINLIRGSNAPLMMVFRMSCCDSKSNSLVLSYDDTINGQTVVREQMLDSNLQGLKNGMGGGLFREKVSVARDEKSHATLERIYEGLKATYQANKIPFPQ